MNPYMATLLREAEEKLALRFPKKIFDFLRKLEQPEVMFGKETWLFPSLMDLDKKVNDHFFLRHSEHFKKIWGLKALVFATNTEGDFLLLLEKESKASKEIFVWMKELAEIRVFNYGLDKLLLHGPLDYRSWEDYYLKLDSGKVLYGRELEKEDDE